MNKIIRLINLEKTYGGVVPTYALKGINLEIHEGEITAIVGQSGSGKSTLLNMIGILDDPSMGEIIINGENINHMTKDQMADFRNKTIGFVFQFHYLLPEFSVLENVLMPSWIDSKIANSENEGSAKELLKLVGLEDVMYKSVTKISGGQKQRTAIARALINNPKIILADEPTGNLDTINTKRVFDLFCKINKTKKTTFVIITHSDQIAKQADRVIELEDGRIVSDKKGGGRPKCA